VLLRLRRFYHHCLIANPAQSVGPTIDAMRDEEEVGNILRHKAMAYVQVSLRVQPSA
jgi:hypothetical protein